ncbi:hypothetical protein [Croceicoccus naphthovorans]|uniref:Uncharacterized protein n=1 Tax=Croceicoccus naphthovorans TaxID=1348774 RepID=A0A0G3XL14_9SPHN|nr:hypothetical protein [Croceicoccus naphthovorans]AKM11296.1 hypothetical protein AB433_17035 [Croceicoccus naphthovorans]MBB3989781.1 hypothetical protein [Croceicoccus naphthovorans]
MGASPFLRDYPHPNASAMARLRWMARSPLATRRGEQVVERIGANPWPDLWRQDMTGRKVLIVGSGPSLDRVDSAFFDGFDTALYINFAFGRAQPGPVRYFFTTDLGPGIEFIARFGDTAFRDAGAARCLYAPIFYDQAANLTPEFLSLFTVIRPERVGWRFRHGTLAGVKLPQTLARYPIVPDFDLYDLPSPASARLPVVETTSALSAAILAGIMGAREIGLIGCDFSAGRAGSVDTLQKAAGATQFRDARSRFEAIAAMLDRHGIATTNHSWLV